MQPASLCSVAASGSPPLQARGLVFAYDRKPALENVSLTLTPGSMTALVGSNGAGKSTLLHLLQGQLVPQAGSVLLGDQPIHRCRSQVALMPQRGRIDWSFPITVREMVALGQVQGPRTSCATWMPSCSGWVFCPWPAVVLMPSPAGSSSAPCWPAP